MSAQEISNVINKTLCRRRRKKRHVLFFCLTLWLGVMFCLFMLSTGHAAEATFSWLPNTETDLGGYKIHYGSTAKAYTYTKDCGLPETVDGRVMCTVDAIPDDMTYYAATAYDKAEQESDFSNEVGHDPAPAAVKGMTVVTVNVKVSMSP